MSEEMTLEILPNELLIEIFRYFSIQHLYRAFSGLKYTTDKNHQLFAKAL